MELNFILIGFVVALVAMALFDIHVDLFEEVEEHKKMLLLCHAISHLKSTFEYRYIVPINETITRIDRNLYQVELTVSFSDFAQSPEQNTINLIIKDEGDNQFHINNLEQVA